MSLPALLRRHDRITVLGLFAMVNGVISIGLMAVAALVTGAPFIFPSLGPTAFLLFYTPMLPTACPETRSPATRSVPPPATSRSSSSASNTRDQHWPPEVTAARVGAAALSLGLTSGLMVWARVPHPPAGATTLIVSLGILHEPWQLAVLMLAVFFLVLQGLGINRLAGIPYPLWGPATDVAGPTSALLEP